VPQAAPAQALAAAPGAPKAAGEGPLPKLQDADLSGPGEVRRFNSDTLYEKIDGKAQLYQSYNFAELLFTSYTAGDASLDVYVYDMGQADNAFGIFKAEQGENAEAVDIGAGGTPPGPASSSGRANSTSTSWQAARSPATAAQAPAPMRRRRSR